MHKQAQVAFIAIIFIFASASIFYAASSNMAQISSSNFTVEEANKTIANTSDYIEMINASGYLIFSPNLTRAYTYLRNATENYKTSPASAILYAGKARREADKAYAAMAGYRTASLAVILILTLAVGFILYMAIRAPTRDKTQKKRRR